MSNLYPQGTCERVTVVTLSFIDSEATVDRVTELLSHILTCFVGLLLFVVMFKSLALTK